jgi:hypothetical protein
VSKRFEDATVAFARIDQRVAAHQARYELCRVSPIGRSAMNSRRLALVAAALAVALVGSACTNDSQSATPAATAATGGSLGLKGVCPDTIVVQKDWQPESEHGFLYNLVGAGYKVDTNNKRVTGPLVAQGRDTGVNLQIRSGGPAVGFQPVSAVMYSDRSIHLGYVATDEAVQFAARQPTTAVMAQLDISPLALIWDLATYPQFTTIADIGQTNTQVLYTDGLTYMEYLVGSNILHRSQLNGSYDGSPALFVQSNGKAALQGFATSEPYLYEHEIKQWGKPLKSSSSMTPATRCTSPPPRSARAIRPSCRRAWPSWCRSCSSPKSTSSTTPSPPSTSSSTSSRSTRPGGCTPEASLSTPPRR